MAKEFTDTIIEALKMCAPLKRCTNCNLRDGINAMVPKRVKYY